MCILFFDVDQLDCCYLLQTINAVYHATFVPNLKPYFRYNDVWMDNKRAAPGPKPIFFNVLGHHITNPVSHESNTALLEVQNWRSSYGGKQSFLYP